MQQISNACTEGTPCTLGATLISKNDITQATTVETKKSMDKSRFPQVFIEHVIKNLRIALPILFFYHAPVTVGLSCGLSLLGTYDGKASELIKRTRDAWNKLTPAFQTTLLVSIIACYHVVPIVLIGTVTCIAAGGYAGIMVREALENIKKFNVHNKETLQDYAVLERASG